jgi:predicted nucleotidyltransferase
VEKIAAEVCPEKLYLFGSRAGGTRIRKADVDVLLVLSGRETRAQCNSKRIGSFAADVAMEFFVMTTGEFESQKLVANTRPGSLGNGNFVHGER